MTNIVTATNKSSNISHHNVIDTYDTHDALIRVLPYWYVPLYLAICSMVTLVALIGNSTLFFIITTTKRLRTPTNYFLLSLVTADLLTTVFLIPFYIERYVDSSGSHCLCLARKYLFAATSSGSIMSLALVSVDRMIAISYPYLYEEKITRHLAFKILVSLWVWILSFNCITFIKYYEWQLILPTCSAGLPKLLYLIVTPTNFYLPGIIIIIAYIKIYIVARRHYRIIVTDKKRAKSFSESTFLDISRINTHVLDVSKCLTDSPDLHLGRIRSETQTSYASTATQASIQATTTECSLNNSPGRQNRKRTATVLSALNEGKRRIKKAKETILNDLRAAKTIGLLVGMFLLCWSPIAGLYIYLNASNRQLEFENEFGYLHDIFMFLSFLNAAIDPYLYALRNKNIKEHLLILGNKIIDRIKRR